MKDNFSLQSDSYARFRPGYPPELYAYIFDQLDHFDRAWDCGTGNGQVAAVLSGRFREVEATDISRQQLARAQTAPNIHYRRQAAEEVTFSDHSFDLITVGQAIHWLEHDRFYPQARRVLRSSGLLAEFGYQLMRSTPAINAVVDRFYHQILGAYWDEERRHIDEGYARIPFPFRRIPTPDFEMSCQWSFEQLIGYLDSWSAVQHYHRKNGKHPVELIRKELSAAWGREARQAIHFRLLLRLGRLFEH